MVYAQPLQPLRRTPILRPTPWPRFSRKLRTRVAALLVNEIAIIECPSLRPCRRAARARGRCILDPQQLAELLDRYVERSHELLRIHSPRGLHRLTREPLGSEVRRRHRVRAAERLEPNRLDDAV